VTDFSQSGDICQSDAAYVLGALSPADRRAFEDHLRDCAECRESVQRLAGMPGLLALTTAETLQDSGPPVPDSLLPGLLARADAARRRRGWMVGGLLAASIALLLALAGTLVLRPSTADTAGAAVTPPVSTSATAGTPTTTTTTTTPAEEPEEMTQVLQGPMSASLELVEKKWGTAITVFCKYDQGVDTSTPYDLAVVDTDGNQTSAGTWRAVPGVTAKVTAATAVPRDRIAALEVQLPDGTTILRYDE
jgi:Putative zinc-finger